MTLRKRNKSCEICKYREFDAYGWDCNKHNTYFNDYETCYDMQTHKCKYYKRDVTYSLSNGIVKYFELNNYQYTYRQGKFIKIKQPEIDFNEVF